ncbi:endonuclease/exonuclease/phosphatase family protein [Nonomuraea sp. NPDC050790]|uniref:endonuclease/exonuclease/phosphatase family protein n=1 Tax=Nonomuraea sp. NPDC050790 TaxID=3364371 RepID=UPI0037BD9B24
MWIVVIPCAAWAVLRVAGVVPAWPWVPLVAFTPYVALASVLPLALAAARRRWAAAGLAAVSCLALACSVLPRQVPEANPPAAGARLRVLSVNLRVGQADPAALVALVRRLRPDVLTFQELTVPARGRMDELGLRQLFPHRVDRPAPGASGSAIYARYPMTELPMLAHGYFRQVRATLTVSGTAVEVVSVHPCAPRYDGRVPCWRQGLDALPRGGGALRVLAGDFNATLDHPPMRALLRSGYRDAADVTGQGLTATWPVMDWTGLPGVQIDHVLASREIAVTEFAVHDLPGTDHRAVSATLRLP